MPNDAQREALVKALRGQHQPSQTLRDINARKLKQTTPPPQTPPKQAAGGVRG